MPGDVQIAGAAGASPQSYEVPNATEIIPRAINATFDGTGAAAAFLPTVEIISDGGVVVARIPTDTTVAAGGSAEVSFFPRVRKLISGVSNTYQALVDTLRGTYQLVAEWHLNDGASPYLDTSGYSVTDPSTMTRQVRVVAMTQSNPSGPLTSASSGPSVKFNFDGTNLISSGDFLTDTIAGTARYYFVGVLPFTVIFWVVPGAGVNTHDGPVISTVHVTGFGTPGAHDDGWQLTVTEPGLLPTFKRFANVTSGNLPDTATGAALSTSAWSMIAGTYDGANMRLYVNGVLAATTASANPIGGASNNAFIGLGSTDQGNLSSWFFGAAAEGTIWAAALPGATIAALYAAATA